MLYSQVVFSFFRYPRRHAPGAFMLMGFQGWVAGKRMPAGVVRLMGCGGRDGFSIVPDFHRYCLMSALEDPTEQADVRRSRLYRAAAGPSSEQLHFTLVPATGHGTWDGEAVFDYSGARVGKRPFVVLTHARVKQARASAFWRSVPGIRQGLHEAPGCAYHIGFGEHPFLTLATFSIWEDLASMQGFAYRRTPHHRVTKAARGDDWLTESLFVRFEIERVEGDLEPHPKLRRLADAGLVATGGTARPDPADYSEARPRGSSSPH
ncbi:MAG: aminodeoxychorismate lyase [Thiohalocapsa sp.]